MSSGHGRSWRPEKQRKERDTRRRTIVLLSAFLVGLVLLMVVPLLMPKEPPVRLVHLTSGPFKLRPSTLTFIPNGAEIENGRQLQEVFSELHELNPARVLESKYADSLENLRALSVANEKLIILCTVEAVVRRDETLTSSVLKFLQGDQEFAFVDLLTTLQESKAEQVILLLDFVAQQRGLANGRLSDDVFPLLKEAVDRKAFSGLTVVCSTSMGQRSWEFIKQRPDVTTVVPNENAKEETVVISGNQFGTFSGTVFGHFVRQAFVEGAAGSAKELSEYLQSNVRSWVEANYGEDQSVLVLPEQNRALSRELLAKIDWPSEADFVAPDPVDLSPASSDGEVAANNQDGKPVPSQPADNSPDAIASRLISEWSRFAAEGEAAASVPQDWIRLTGQLVSLQRALLDGSQPLVESLASDAEDTIQSLKLKLKSGTNNERGREFAPWLASLDSDSEATDLSAIFNEALAEIGSEETPGKIARELRRDGQPRDEFVDWLIDDLIELSRVLPAKTPDAQMKELAIRSRFIQRLDSAGWPRDEWREELFTIAEVLSGDNSEWHVKALKPLTKLIRQRQYALALASGFIADEADESAQLLRKSVWDSVKQDIRLLTTRLTAAERWLTLGEVGLRMAVETLDETEHALERIGGRVREQQQRIAILDSQQTELPLTIQFLAQQQEEVALSDSELDSAEAMAKSLLDGTSISADSFPPALLKEPGMKAEDITAMFALTRDFEDGPTDSDLSHQRRLRDYVSRRITESSTSSERERLLSLPLFGSDRQKLVERFSEPGQVTLPGERRRSGLWLGFWSIRLLDAVSGEEQTELWQQWLSLIQSVRGDSQKECIEARATLAASLRKQWDRQYESLANARGRSIFVTKEDSLPLIAADLEQRANTDSPNAGTYALFYRQIAGKEPTKLTASVSAPAEVLLDENNTASLVVQTSGGQILYVNRTAAELADSNAEQKQGWYKLSAAGAINLKFQSNSGLTSAAEISLAIANEDDVIVESSVTTIHPNGQTVWVVDFLDVNGQKQIRREADLELPPSTRDPKDPTKYTPIPLTVRISQKDGVSKRIQVQCFDSRDTPFWSSPQQLTLKNDNSVDLPLAPAPVEGANPQPGAPLQVDVMDGFRIDITPLDLVGAATTSIRIQPILSEAREFVVRPTPVYDADSHELTFRVDLADRIAALKQKTIPLSVHFSPALNRVRVGSGTSMQMPNIPPDGQEFKFSFSDRIQQEFEEETLEFSLSVAGIPYAWRWRLTENGVESMAADLPEVRAELTLANPKEVKAIPGQKFILVGEGWENASLDVEMNIHGGRFFRNNPEWDLNLYVENLNTRQRTSVIDDAPIPVRSRYNENIVVSAGTTATWNFSTHTALYGRRNLKIQADRGLGAGRYELIAQLNRKTGNDDPKEYRTLFVFDATEPVVEESNITVASRVWVTDNLSGQVTAKDLESGIASIEVGLLESALRPLKISNSRTDTDSGAFLFKPTSEGFPKIQRTSQLEEAEGTLFVKVTNKAGLVTTEKKRITFVSKPLAMAEAESAPAKPGAVSFTWKTKTPYTVSLVGKNGFKKVATGTGSVEFADVPPGSYNLEWNTGLATGNGSMPVTVLSGKTASKEK